MHILNRLARATALVMVFVGMSLVLAGASKAADLWSPGLKDDVGQPAFRWTGLYIGGNLGYQVGDTEFSGALNGLGSASIDGLSSDGWKYGVRAGFDWQAGNSPFVIGAFVGYDWGDQDFDVNVSAPGLSGSVLGYSIEPTWHVGARAGVLLSPSALVYVGYAYGQAKYDLHGAATQFLCGNGSPVDCSDTLNGHTFLAGSEMRITDNITAALEYNYTQYDSHTFYSDQNVRVKADSDVHAVSVRLNWRPGFNLF